MDAFAALTSWLGTPPETYLVSELPTAEMEPDLMTQLAPLPPYVREITNEAGMLRLYVEDGSESVPELLRLLDRESLPIKSISLSEPTLDDVFLHHTGRSLRDASADTGTQVAA